MRGQFPAGIPELQRRLNLTNDQVSQVHQAVASACKHMTTTGAKGSQQRCSVRYEGASRCMHDARSVCLTCTVPPEHYNNARPPQLQQFKVCEACQPAHLLMHMLADRQVCLPAVPLAPLDPPIFGPTFMKTESNSIKAAAADARRADTPGYRALSDSEDEDEDESQPIIPARAAARRPIQDDDSDENSET